MMSITRKYEEICMGIIRPYREEYKTEELGPTSFELSGKKFIREDLTLRTFQGKLLQCSFYYQQVHAHTGSRKEALPILPVLLPSNINVFSFDFTGSGLSEGEFISLGWFERENIATVVNFLRENDKVLCIGLWGRGMGAVSALLYTDRDPCIGGMILDSPFISLKQLAEEEINKRVNVAGFIKSAAISFVRKHILQCAKFDINDLSTLEHVVNTFVPAIFCCAKNDEFIHPHHTEELYEAYPGDKKLSVVDGNHTSSRPKYFLDSVAIFFYNALQVENIKIPTSIEEPNEVPSDDSYEML